MAHSQKQSVLMIFECSTCKILCARFWQMVTTKADESGIELVFSIPICWEDHQLDNIPLGRGDVFVMMWRVQVAWMKLS